MYKMLNINGNGKTKNKDKLKMKNKCAWCIMDQLHLNGAI